MMLVGAGKYLDLNLNDKNNQVAPLGFFRFLELILQEGKNGHKKTINN